MMLIQRSHVENYFSKSYVPKLEKKKMTFSTEGAVINSCNMNGIKSRLCGDKVVQSQKILTPKPGRKP